MSISKMKKLVLIVPSDNADTVIKALISLRCIDIGDFSCKEYSDLLQKNDYSDQITLVKNKINKTEAVISALSKYRKKRARLGDGRVRVDRESFVSSGEYNKATEIVEKAYFSLQALEDKKTEKDSTEAASKLEGEILGFVGDFDKLETLFDVESTNLEIIKIKQKAAYSDTCTFIVGWMPRKFQKRVEGVLAELLCAYEITEPTQDDEPPVRINNNFFTRSFEWITSGFGTPKSSSFDPTLIMSVFYFLAFGLMIHDVGYGFILALLGFAGAKLLSLRGKMKSVLNMLGVCGISSIIFGVIFGGWLGNMPYAIMNDFLYIESARELVPLFHGIWFRAIENPLYYLAVCGILGAIQIIVGMIVRFVLLCREGRAVDALLDIAPWWIVFAGIAVSFALNLIAGLIAIGVGVLVIIIFHGRDEKKALARIGKGFLGVGKIAFYVIDLLGYLKLFVVGISVGIITYFVNWLGTLMGPTAIGYVVFVLVSVLGHAICLCFATISAVVFAKSIQYTEFSRRIFVCGGKRFLPAEPCEKYTRSIYAKERVGAV